MLSFRKIIDRTSLTSIQNVSHAFSLLAIFRGSNGSYLSITYLFDYFA